MPPYRGGSAGRGGGAGAGQGALSRLVTGRDNQIREYFDDINSGTVALAAKLGMEENSLLDKEAHMSLAVQVQKLAAGDATLEIKRAATTNALMCMAAELDKRAARNPGAGGGADDPSPEEMEMSYFLDGMRTKVAAAMQGADQKALLSNTYKDTMKKISAMDDGVDDDIIIDDQRNNEVSLKCPINLTTIVDPVKSKVCGHSYGRAAILNHIRVDRGRGSACCPVAGCQHQVTRDDLEPDKDMMRRLRIEQNTQKSEEQMDDAEEIDDDENIRETMI